jgi:hypothetical protein
VSSSGFIAGLTTGRRRAHTPRALFISSFALVLAALVAVAERRVEWFGAASRALSGVVFGLLIPVALVATSGQVLFPTRLAASATFFARFGASRRSVALGLVVASMCTAAILAAAMGAVTALIAHDPTAPPPAADALTTAWIGLFTGAAYAGLYAFGATFGAKGGGRYWALVLDLLLGAGGMTSALAPRAHAQNLLGGAPPLMFSQSQSAAALLVLAALTTLLALARLPP